jgi:[NiFe] hydrogenase large subunit
MPDTSPTVPTTETLSASKLTGSRTATATTPTASTTPTGSVVGTGTSGGSSVIPGLGGKRVILDPVTRIEGHLRMEILVEDGIVKDAWASGGLYRGMENVLVGREPTDAFYIAQRICGVCPVSHGHAATMAGEKALGIEIPNNARIIRNLIEGAELLHSHILWFYTLTALDYVDVAAAVTADVGKAYEAARTAGTRISDFAAVQSRLAAFVNGGQLSIFSNGWWGHPAYALPPELSLVAVAHYLEALDIQAEAAAIIATMGGKFPHFMTSVPGGTSWVPTTQKLDGILYRIARIKAFIDEAMVPDTLAIAPYYLEATKYGKGVGNYLAWGVFDTAGFDPAKRFLPRGAIVDGKLTSVIQPDTEHIVEYTDHAWYSSDSGTLNPKDGVTVGEFAEYDTNAKYSWVKAPRLDGHPMEVGPLARLLVGYAQAVPEIVESVDGALKALGVAGKLDVLQSLLGRVAARNLEAQLVATQMAKWAQELVDALKGGDSAFFTATTASEGDGAGLWEAPRGALGHWMSVRAGKIARYQVVTPSTWNISPRDADGKRGPLEEALVGSPIVDVTRPLEAMRIVHSFDP